MDGVALGWLIPGILFELMAFGPLLGAIPAIRAATSAQRAVLRDIATVMGAAVPDAVTDAATTPATRSRGRPRRSMPGLRATSTKAPRRCSIVSTVSVTCATVAC